MKDHASKLAGLAWLIAAVALAAAFAFGISPLVRAIPWSWERGIAGVLGSTVSNNVCGGDPASLKLLVDRLYPLDREDARFTIKVQIVKNPDVNAFAELGGKIALNTGLLEKAGSAEEVAGVLAHEIEHVRRRHILEGFIIHLMTVEGIKALLGATSNMEWTNYFLHMGFNRSQETEADEGALVRLQKAHVNNQGFKDFFKRMKEMSSVPSFLSDHPSDESRSEMAGKFQNKDTKPIMTDEEWKDLKKYCQ